MPVSVSCDSMNNKNPILSIILMTALIHPISSASKSTEDIRRLKFPTGYPMGTLWIAGFKHSDKAVVAARGAVSITVPPGMELLLDLNPHVLEQPGRLAEVPTEGINGLKIGFMSMDENSVCDEAIKMLPRFIHPISIDASRSDLTDKGVSAFKSLDYLHEADFFMSGVDGDFLRNYHSLPRLSELRLGASPFKESNLQYMANLPSLTVLRISKSHVTDEGVKHISKIRNLRSLSLTGNTQITDEGIKFLAANRSLQYLRLSEDSKITDKSIPIFAALTNLKRLDLGGTAITAPAMEKLKVLKQLENIQIPKHYYEVEMVKLRKIFPKAQLRKSSEEPSEEIKIQFAPIVK